MIAASDIDIEEVVCEVRDAFQRYETALNENDLATLDGYFLNSSIVVRFGISENLYGIEAIRKFRQLRHASGLRRSLENTTIHTFGADFATTTTEFIRSNGVTGRQSQSWVRFTEGWRIVSAHVSFISTVG